MTGDRREVKLMPEYVLGDVPPWPRADETDAMLPPDLLERLLRWQQVFEGSYHHEKGWRDAKVKENWAKEAEELEQELRQALPPDVVLTVDLWPLRGR